MKFMSMSSSSGNLRVPRNATLPLLRDQASNESRSSTKKTPLAGLKWKVVFEVILETIHGTIVYLPTWTFQTVPNGS